MKVISKVLLAIVITVSMVLTMTVPSTAAPKGRPIVKVSECIFDFDASTYWRPTTDLKKIARGEGGSVDLWKQVIAMRNSLPQRCWSRCNFTNIPHDSFWLHMMNRRFVPKTIVSDSLFDTFKQQCASSANTPTYASSITGGSGSGEICVSGNSFSLTVRGSGTHVGGSQDGCNSAVIRINGDNVTVYFNQSGFNRADLTFDGDNINFGLSQTGSHTYTGYFTSGYNGVITQG